MKISKRFAHMLVFAALVTLITCCIYNLCASIGQGHTSSIPLLATQFPSNESIPEIGKQNESDNFRGEGDEQMARHLYPSTSAPPHAIKNALDWSTAHIQDKLPSGSVRYTSSAKISTTSSLSSTAWTSLGPQPLDSSAGTHADYRWGLVGGRINALAVVSASGSISPTIYAASDGGGVWKSTNCCYTATTWTALGSNDPYLSSSVIGAIAIDPVVSTTIYAGSGDHDSYFYPVFGSRGILNSVDGGANWKTVGGSVFDGANGSDPQRITAIAVDKNHNNVVMVGTLSTGTNSGFYMSFNSGTSWQHCAIASTSFHPHEIVSDISLDYTISPTVMYVALGNPIAMGSTEGIYTATVPTNNLCPPGLWHPSLPAPTSGPAWGRIQMAIAPSDHNTLYAVVAQPLTITMGVYSSTNGGASWLQASDYSAYMDCHAVQDHTSFSWFDLTIKVDPTLSTTVYVGNTNLYKSTDSGKHFLNLTNVYATACSSYGSVHPDQHAIAFLPNTSKFVVGNDGGLYYSGDSGSTFSQLNNTLSNLTFYNGDLTPNFANDPSAKAFGGMQDNGSSYYTGTLAWQRPGGGDGFYTAIEPISQTNWYWEYDHGQLNCSTTGPTGTYNQCFNNDLMSTGFNTPFVLDHLNCSTNCAHIILGTYRVWESTTGGTTGSSWNAISGDLTKGGNDVISALAFAPKNTKIIYSGSSGGQMTYTNNGDTGSMATWITLTYSTQPNRAINDIAVTPDSAITTTSPMTAYVAFDGFDENTPSTPGHLYRVTCTDTSCANHTWTNLSTILPNVPAYSVVVNPLNVKQVFVGTEIGFFYTDDITALHVGWYKFQTGLPVTPIYKLTVDSSPSGNGNTTLAAWTFGRGMYAVLLPNPTWTVAPSPNPGTFQNQLFGVAKINSYDVWAVGNYYTTTGTGYSTMALHWDGGSWTRYTTPNPSPNYNYLIGVAATPGNDLWAVGSYYSSTMPGFLTLADHYNGSWNQVNTPNPGNSDNRLEAVSASTITDVWAVGYYQTTFTNYRTLILHSNGTTWSQVASPNESSNNNELLGVVAVSPTDAWAVGYYIDTSSVVHTLILRWSSGIWSQYTSPDPGRTNQLNAVTRTPDGSIWAVGSYIDAICNCTKTLTEQWNGSSWQQIASPSGGSLLGVAGTAANDIWAVGYSANDFTSSTLTLHWDGNAWSVVSSPSPGNNNYLYGVAAIGSTDVWAAGYDEAGTLTLHLGNGGWGLKPK